MKHHSFALVAMSLLFACSGDKPAPSQPNAGAPAGGAAPMEEDHHGERHALGSLTVAGHTFEVVQYGDAKPGGEAAIDLEWPAGKQRPKVVRAWVGVESGQGSMKARLNPEGDRVMHNHVEMPKQLPEGSALWIEIEDGEQKGKASIALHG